MPERLELALRGLEVEWPETPDLAGAVLARLESEPRPASGPAARRGLPAWRPALAYGLATVLAAFAVTMAVSPAARSAVLEFLGLKGARIERREPTATPRATPPAPLGADLGLGSRVTLRQAEREAGFRVLLPSASRLGAPDAVYVDDPFGLGARVSLVYGRRRGIQPSEHTGAALLVMELLADVNRDVIRKATGGGAVVEPLRVDGERGYFISGTPHGFAFVTPDGDAEFEEQRLAGNTLLLERGDLLLRVEGELSRAEAIAIARSMR